MLRIYPNVDTLKHYLFTGKKWVNQHRMVNEVLSEHTHTHAHSKMNVTKSYSYFNAGLG